MFLLSRFARKRRTFANHTGDEEDDEDEDDDDDDEDDDDEDKEVDFSIFLPNKEINKE